MPVVLSDSSTTTRPSPLLPRRKSTSRNACVTSPGRGSAKRCTEAAWSAGTAPVSASVTRTSRPSTVVSNVCGVLRLNTTRVRFPACTKFRLRSVGLSTGRWLLGSALDVSGKSSAIRGGFAMANPAGGFAGGAFSVNFTTVRPDAPRVTETCSIALDACAKACAETTRLHRATTTALHARRMPIIRRVSLYAIICCSLVLADPAAG